MFSNKSVLLIIIFLFKHAYIDGRLHNGVLNCHDTCLNRTTKLHAVSCFCTECDLYEDCCKDVQQQVLNERTHECNIRLAQYEHVYSVSKCPFWYSADRVTKKNCENDSNKSLLNRLPVFSVQTKNAYRNVYCAMCNIENIDLNLIQTFQPIVGHEFFLEHGFYQESDLNQTKHFESKIIDEFLNGSSRVYLTLRNNSFFNSLRRCVKSIDTCQPGSSENEIKMCQAFTSYRYTKYKVYRNEHCALCNKETLRDLACSPVRIRTSIQKLFDVSSLFDKQLGDLLECPQNEEKTVEELIKKYITIIGHLVSIISLILLLCVYSTSKKLRNFPGKLLICLSICLLISQLVFILAHNFTRPSVLPKECHTKNDVFDLNEIYKPCYILAFLTHYFYLAFFFWSNVMAYDLYHMFSILSNSNSKSASANHEDLELKNIRFIKYSAYAWCAPLLICLILIIKQFVASNLAYGFKICFISEPLDLLIFFVLPVALVLLANIFFLMRSIFSIRQVDKMTNKFLKKEDESSSNLTNSDSKNRKKRIKTNNAEKKRLVLYLKLFILTGMTWILGVITSFNKESFIWHVYIVLNSFQGLFIFISFAFSPQSRRYFKSTALYSRLSSNMFRKSTSKSDTGGASSSIINSQKT